MLGLIYSPIEYYLVILGDIVMAIAVVLTVVSGVEYCVKNSNVLKEDA